MLGRFIKRSLAERKNLYSKSGNIAIMRIYIGYKYTNIQDKQTLINNLLEFASELEKKGHKTFILGRDVQDWKGSMPLWRTFGAIVSNMLKSDAFVAYITSEVPSKGLGVEKFLSRLLRKKSFIFNQNGQFNDSESKAMFVLDSLKSL